MSYVGKIYVEGQVTGITGRRRQLNERTYDELYGVTKKYNIHGRGALKTKATLTRAIISHEWRSFGVAPEQIK